MNDHSPTIDRLLIENAALKRQVEELQRKLGDLHEAMAQRGGGPTLPERLYQASKDVFCRWRR